MITCVKCKKGFPAPTGKAGETSSVTCPECGAVMKIRWKESGATPPGAGKVKVLVAVDGEASQEFMNELLTQAGYQVLVVGNGREALLILEKERPQAAYLDVALPQVLGFEVCEMVKKSPLLKDIKVILVSSIYDKFRYKSPPSSLYGADDYIERHEIQEEMVARLKKVLNPPPAENTPKQSLAMPAMVAPAPPAPAPKMAAPAPAPPAMSAGDQTLHDEARRFARIIVADIALYNQKAIEEGLENGNIEELLKDDMMEAERTYKQRVSREIREKSDYLKDALRELIDRRKSLLKK